MKLTILLLTITLLSCGRLSELLGDAKKVVSCNVAMDRDPLTPDAIFADDGADKKMLVTVMCGVGPTPTTTVSKVGYCSLETTSVTLSVQESGKTTNFPVSVDHAVVKQSKQVDAVAVNAKSLDFADATCTFVLHTVSIFNAAFVVAAFLFALL